MRKMIKKPRAESVSAGLPVTTHPADAIPDKGELPTPEETAAVAAKRVAAVAKIDAQTKKARNTDSDDAILAGIAAAQRNGSLTVMTREDLNSLMFGIPCPALAFEFLLGLAGFPLGHVIQLTGSPGSGKSGAIAEFGNWFAAAGGALHLNENETKISMPWYRAIMRERLDPPTTNITRTGSLEDWQTSVSELTRNAKLLTLDKKHVPQRHMLPPLMIAVDTIMAKLTEGKQERIFGKKGVGELRGKGGEGHGSKSYPDEANILTEYFKGLPQEIDRWPIALVFANHSKQSLTTTGAGGSPTRTTPGGMQVKYQMSFDIEMAKFGGKIACSEWEGFKVRMSTFKNSFDLEGRSMETRCLVWDEADPETLEWQRRAQWDWHWATVNLLWKIMLSPKPQPRFKANLAKIDFHLATPKTSDIENRAWSASLGQKEKDAMPWSELGALLVSDPEILRRLRWALRIDMIPYWSDLRDKLRKEASSKGRKEASS